MMKTLRAIFVRFAGLFRRKQHEAEMNAELRAHLDGLIARNLAAGISRAEARHAALRTFGGAAQIAERARDERRSAWGEHLVQDVRYAMRALRKNPGFTVAAVLTLALGIGVNAALFTLYNAVALRSLPARAPEELVLFRANGSTGGPRFSYPEYRDYREGNRSFSGLAAWMESNARLNDPMHGSAETTAFSGGGPGSAVVQFVSDDYFAVIGANFTLGRDFLPEESGAAGGLPVIVLSHLFWERQLDSDSNVLGKTISLNGTPHTVIGVTAPGFVGHQPAPPAGWIPLTSAFKPTVLNDRNMELFRFLGRLKPDVTEVQAGADMKRISEIVKRLHPGEHWQDVTKLDRGMKFMNIPANAKFVQVATPLVLGFALVLVIACTNVANLLLARGVTRQQEIGVRLTLGASRGRVLRQLLTENLLLCAISAVCGVLLANWTLAFALTHLPIEWGENPGEIRPWQFLHFGWDWRIAGYTVLAALVASVAAGLVPALHAARTDLISTLKNEGSVFGRRLSQSRLRSLLIVVQVAVCMTLLSCAGLLARNLFALRDLDLGYDPKTVFRAFALPKGVPGRPTANDERRGLETLQALPGVVAASRAVWGERIKGWSGPTPVRLPDSSVAEAAASLRTALVSAAFFETLGVSLPMGRAFTPQEVDTAAAVVVVSEAAARTLWPGRNPIGQSLAVDEAAFTGSKRPSENYREHVVIGVAPDVRNGVRDQSVAYLYFPLRNDPGVVSRTFVRLRSGSATALADLRRSAEAAGATLWIDAPLSARHERDMLPFRLLAWLSGALGLLALSMATVGLYGVMAFSINRRVREIGIRVALGASAQRVIRLFVRQGMRLVAVGIGLGLVGGGLFALVLRKATVGLGGTFDPVALGGVTLVLATVAFVACWLPARRAAKVEPMVALRAE